MADIDTGSNAFLRRAYDLTGPRDAAALYDEWADTYDADTDTAMGYVGPEVAAGRLTGLLDEPTTVLDAGCGTGLVGAEIARRGGGHVVDGLDVSPAMLAKARATGHYRDVAVADLTVALPVADDAYGAVVCVGTLTEGHVGPEAIAEFVRVTAAGGFVVATVLDAIWEPQGYRAAVDDLVATGRAVLREAERHRYRTRQDVDCRLIVVEAR